MSGRAFTPVAGERYRRFLAAIPKLDVVEDDGSWDQHEADRGDQHADGYWND